MRSAVDLPNLDHAVELAGDGSDLCARLEGGDVTCLLREPDGFDTLIDLTCTDGDETCTNSRELTKLDVGITGDVVTLAGTATWRGPAQTRDTGFKGFGAAKVTAPTGSYRFKLP